MINVLNQSSIEFVWYLIEEPHPTSGEFASGELGDFGKKQNHISRSPFHNLSAMVDYFSLVLYFQNRLR